MKEAEEQGGEISLETGSMTKESLEVLLNTLPVDLTFVNAEDKVQYFSQSKARIFPRAKAVIGRKVQQCHPQKSVHKVNQIMDDFKSGSFTYATLPSEAKTRNILAAWK